MFFPGRKSRLQFFLIRGGTAGGSVKASAAAFCGDSIEVDSVLSNEDIVLRIRNGERDLIGELYERNRGLLRIYVKPYINAGMEEADAMQECFFAILDALERYDPTRGTFNSCLEFSVKNIVGRAFRASRYSKRIPDNLQITISKYNRLINDYIAENGSPPDDYYLCFFLGLSQTQLDDLRTVIKQSKEVSIYEQVPGTEDIIYQDAIQDPEDAIEAAEEQIDRERARRDLWATVGTLPASQAEIIKARYRDGKTVREITEETGATKGKIRNAESKGLYNLRRKINIKQIARRFDYGTRTLYGGGLNAFMHSHTSPVELAVLKHIEWEQNNLTN